VSDLIFNTTLKTQQDKTGGNKKSNLYNCGGKRFVHIIILAIDNNFNKNVAQ
jgi:hypothetical protein